MKSPKSTPCLTPQDDIDPALSRKLSSLKDRLAFDIERQFESLHDELLHELEDFVKKNDRIQNASPTGALSSLVHTVTDSKIHQMNLELRQYMTAKMDALLQDINDEQQAFQQRIQLELDQRLATSAVYKHPTGRWWYRVAGRPRAEAWISLPALIAGTALLIVLISWP
ncbi:MAG: hypothetical protein CMK83_06940 [Pseudomonadales bacterium]|jgi:hypothetical protein|nr:hypothetical protein [Pseudomonadales bacterium]MEC8811352.1 hypothetical protein [Pseudomonadota bacterium]TNC86862.1 MAG: hypothetical protein CSH49_15840 [Alcanivorax sp.]HAG95171.1 hypothetical protein [Gammaproteobacteria bacterium]MBI26075.1 hypothetical protein [Pseudomonadales bacterium]|tara:strand:+ start:9635 stop:10141 length:507 start_codon:yes stop_codon:yes gene_type:complete